ncbi:MAG: FxLD family lantipeptide [Streptosporangiales bacterium]|nr:FxLD family lantipeptide [Streptosporangiales bacterium]
MSATDTLDAFTLDVRIIEDVRPGGDQIPCATDNGCDPTCASACTGSST